MVQRYLLLLLAGVLLASCTVEPTRAQLLETAVAGGCWPDPYDTPAPVTVTVSGPSPTATVSPTPITDMLRVTPEATQTPAATTTPFPRCPPAPGATLIPWPTPIPPEPPLPTFAPAPWQQGSTLQTTIQLPGPYGVHLAVHPTENWPAVALWTRLWNDPMTGFVAVYNPHTQRWSTTQQVDVGASSIGDDRWGNIVVTITGVGEVVAVWGASDKGGNAPSGGIWTASSADYGTSWSQPQRIEAGSCYWPSDVDSTLDGQVAVLAWCGYPSVATLIRRTAQGRWQPATRVGQALGNMGALRVVGNGANAQLVALTTSFTPSAPDPRSLTIVRQPLSGGAPILTEVPYPLDPGGGMPYRHHGLHFVRTVNGIAQEGVQFTFATFPGADVYAVTSYDAGRTWSPAERIVYEVGEQPNLRNEVVSGYDPRADAFVSIWTCCGKNSGVHSASVRGATSRTWETVADPLVDGATLADRTAAAQAAGLGSLWLAWIEAPDKVEVRSLELNTLIDPARYPTVTPIPSITPRPTP